MYRGSERLRAFGVPPLLWAGLVLVAAGCGVAGGDDETWTEEERESVSGFISGLEELRNGLSVLNQSAPGSLSAEERERALEHLRRAREQTAAVGESVLAKIHPELPVQVRARLLNGLDDRIFGLEDGRPSRFFWGTSRLNEWAEWYDRTRSSWNLPRR
ncbi:MAG: hypothetical protein ACOC8K_00185 [Gemmatimonadota bacterium]